MQLAKEAETQMNEYERKYTDIEGTKVENELARIILRYHNEGRSEEYNNQGNNGASAAEFGRKQVRFEAASEDNASVRGSVV
jgi:hypothetical protein